MAQEPEVINVDPDSDIARIIAGAGGKQVMPERNAVRYRLTREHVKIDDPDDISTDHNSKRALAGMRADVSSWSDIDGEALITRNARHFIWIDGLRLYPGVAD